ncbi:hypothetical protein KEM56_007056 [Ascosphaera pollenicola]|nr:hypothetical protein KEM56_007056 [Ascosphaera pollenicola]
MSHNLSHLIGIALAEGFRLSTETWDTLLSALQANDPSKNPLDEQVTRALEKWRCENQRDLHILRKQCMGLQMLGLLDECIDSKQPLSRASAIPDNTDTSSNGHLKRRRLDEVAVDSGVSGMDASSNTVETERDGRSVSPPDSESDSGQGDCTGPVKSTNPSQTAPAIASSLGAKTAGSRRESLIDKTSECQHGWQAPGVTRRECSPSFVPKVGNNVRKAKQEPQTPAKMPSGSIEVIELD